MLGALPSSRPGLTFGVRPAAARPDPLRSDVAGFIGRTERGPVGVPVRVEGWRAFTRIFGGRLADGPVTPHALYGYFANGGEVAWVVRVAEPLKAKPAEAIFDPACLHPQEAWQFEPLPTDPALGALTLAIGVAAQGAAAGVVAAQGVAAGVTATVVAGTAPIAGRQFRVVASSPGPWAQGLRVDFAYRPRTSAGPAAVDFQVLRGAEEVESFRGIAPYLLASFVEANSNYFRLEALGPSTPGKRRHGRWSIRLSGGQADPPSERAYLDAVDTLSQEPEVALVASPDIHLDLAEAEAWSVTCALLRTAGRSLDRLVVLDVPWEERGAHTKDLPEVLTWVDRLRSELATEPSALQAGAIYHPYLRVPDAQAPAGRPFRTLPPSGHVAGFISRLDRERGAGYTPANAPLREPIDLEQLFDATQEAALHAFQVNPIRMQRPDGAVVWGGRTLDAVDSSGRFVAHRRLLHRLVRAVRRAAQPAIFEPNTPDLRLFLVRAITSVLVDAWHLGVLKGGAPGEAFHVQCDDETNPPDAFDSGMVVCEVGVAPATPMEFIHLRISLSRDGSLEVLAP